MIMNRIILCIILISSFGLLASDIYLPALDIISRNFHVPHADITLTISAYLVALAVSQLFYAPFITYFGSKTTLLVGISLYFLSAIGCAYSSTLIWFLGFRILQGIGAASGLVIGRVLISQYFSAQQIPHIYAIVYPCVALSPALAPLIGGYLTHYFGWHSNFIFIACFALFSFLVCLRYLPQCYLPKINIWQSYCTVLHHPKFIQNTLVVCCIYQAWFVYLTQSAFIFKDLHLSEQTIGFLYIPLSIGIIVANIYTKRALKYYSSQSIIKIGLLCFLLGGIGFYLLPISVTSLVGSMFLVSLANGSSLSLAVSEANLPQHSATASSLIGFLQISSAGICSYTVSVYFGHSYSVLAISILTLACLSLFIYQIGRHLPLHTHLDEYTDE